MPPEVLYLKLLHKRTLETYRKMHDLPKAAWPQILVRMQARIHTDSSIPVQRDRKYLPRAVQALINASTHMHTDVHAHADI